MINLRVHPIAHSNLMEWRYEVELMDTADVSAQKEKLTILTHVGEPFPNHPQGVNLAALRHVRDLLNQEIAALESL